MTLSSGRISLFDWMDIDGEVHTLNGKKRLCVWGGPDLAEIEIMFRNYFFSEPSLIDHLQRADEIWIKPNITGEALPEEGKTTQPIVLDALLTVLGHLIGNMKRIYIADSSVIGCDTSRAASIAGIMDICHKNIVKFVDLRDVPYENVKVQKPFLFEELQINAPFLSRNVFKINVSKIKTTYGSPAGFCVKNSKGIITDDLKLKFHLAGIQKALCDLAQVVDWEISILEGFPMSELGKPAGSGPFGISADAVLLDTFLCACMGIPLSIVEHLQELSRMRGINEKLFEQLSGYKQFRNSWPALIYSSQGVKDLAKRYSVDIEDGDACSACVESLAKALSRLQRENLLPIEGRLFAGAQNDNKIIRKAADLRPVFVGNCAFDRVAMELHQNGYPAILQALWRGSVKIEGCPPTIDGMVKKLSSLVCSKESAVKGNGVAKSLRIEAAFDISPIQIFLDASIYRKIIEVIPSEGVSFFSFGLEKALACEVICAAICHQMTWEFLRRSVYDAICGGAEWWRPENIGEVDLAIIENLLSNYSRKERIRAKERSEMLRSLICLFDENTKTFCDVFGIDEDGNRRSPTDIIKNLCRAPVFSEDPESKKLQVLVHNLAHTKVIPNVEELCEPAIDYHIMRLYLRRGDVYPVSKVGKEFIDIKTFRRSNTVTALRSVVSEALRYACAMAHLPINTVNTIEWWIGRSVCLRGKPDCELTGNGSDWLRSIAQQCPFCKTCTGYNCDKKLLLVDEPLHNGRLY